MMNATPGDKDVWLTGVEAHVDDAPARVARVLNIDGEAAALLVASAPVAVRRQVDAKSAAQYVLALGGMGIIAETRATAAPRPAAAPAPRVAPAVAPVAVAPSPPEIEPTSLVGRAERSEAPAGPSMASLVISNRVSVEPPENDVAAAHASSAPPPSTPPDTAPLESLDLDPSFTDPPSAAADARAPGSSSLDPPPAPTKATPTGGAAAPVRPAPTKAVPDGPQPVEIKLLDMPDPKPAMGPSLFGLALGVVLLGVRGWLGMSSFGEFRTHVGMTIDGLGIALVLFMLFRIGESRNGHFAAQGTRRGVKALLVLLALVVPWSGGLPATGSEPHARTDLPECTTESAGEVAKAVVMAAGTADAEAFEALMLGTAERGEAADTTTAAILREIGWYRMIAKRDRVRFLQIHTSLAGHFLTHLSPDVIDRLSTDWDDQAPDPWRVRVTHSDIERPIDVTVVGFQGRFRPIDAKWVAEGEEEAP